MVYSVITTVYFDACGSTSGRRPFRFRRAFQHVSIKPNPECYCMLAWPFYLYQVSIYRLSQRIYNIQKSNARYAFSVFLLASTPCMVVLSQMPLTMRHINAHTLRTAEVRHVTSSEEYFKVYQSKIGHKPEGGKAPRYAPSPNPRPRSWV
jgi:hypothetical protein